MERNKLKIFISAYACEPNLGSEIGVGWHWVLEMSKYFDLWVLTRKSNQQSIENWLKDHSEFAHINFLYFDLPYYLRFWKKGMRGVRTYYNLWQYLTNTLVKKTMQENTIQIFHHLTYGNALWTVSSYGQKQFFIWGPTGVGDIVPSDFSRYYTRKGKIIEFLRRLSVKSLNINKAFSTRCNNADLIFCKTQNTFDSLPNKCRNKAIIFTDVAVENLDTAKFQVTNSYNNDIIKYYSVGRLDAWRGFDLLIEAFYKAHQVNSKIQLEILGKGSDEKRLQALIVKYKLESVITLAGQVSMKEYYTKMANCDVVVNPCLKEGAVTTAFDSMSFAKPLICIDTGGYTNYFNNEYAIVIPLTGRDEVITKLAEGVLQLTDSSIRKKKGDKAKQEGLKFTWDNKGVLISQEIMNRYGEWQNSK